ncbi:MAG: RNA polymerase sigma factor [Phycisphaerae bacterium]
MGVRPSGGDHLQEKRLVRRAQRGDREALRELIDGHRDRLFAFVLRTVRHHHDAEEICQDAFLKAFKALDSFNSNYRFSTWLFTIGYRLCLNRLRRKKEMTGEVDFGTFAGQEASADLVTAHSEEARQLQRVVWDAVDKLSTAQRATVMLFYQQQRGCAEIAEILELPVATVKSHLHRARAKLKDILEPELVGDYSRLRILTELAG